MFRCHAVIHGKYSIPLDPAVADSKIPISITDLCDISTPVKRQDHLATILFLWCQELHFKLSHMNRQIDIFLRAVPWCLHQIFAQGSILNLWSQHLLGGKKTDHVRHDPAFHAHMQSPFRKVLLLCNILVNIAGYCNFLFCCVQIINEISFVSHSQPFVLQ